MNLNQAKAVAGISASQSISGRKGIEQAIKQCVRAIISARKLGDDGRAADLSEAKEVFRKRLGRNGCAVCNVAISPKATHCQLHAKRKQLPPAEDIAALKAAPKNSNARIDCAPVGGEKATMGFYSKRVQDVLEKWKESKLRDEWIEEVFLQVSRPIKWRGNSTTITIPYYQLWAFAAELMAAVANVFTDKRKPEYWLLTLPIRNLTNGKYPGFDEIRNMILQSSGPDFSLEQLRVTYSRLKLATPKEVSRAFRRDMKWRFP